MKTIKAADLAPGMVYTIRGEKSKREWKFKVLTATKGGHMKGHPDGTYIEGYVIEISGDPNARKPYVFGCGVDVHIED